MQSVYSPTESLLGVLLLALLCLKLVDNGRRNKNPANARFGLGLFQNEHARVALRALRVEEEDVFLLKRLHGRLVDTLELFFNHDGCRSGCDALRRNIDTVPCQTKNFNDSHTACKGRVDSQLQMGIIANIKCEKNVSASQTSRFWDTALGTVAWRVGFFSISSYFCLFLPYILSRS